MRHGVTTEPRIFDAEENREDAEDAEDCANGRRKKENENGT